MLCFCEDVRGHEIRAELAAGYADPELVKRRTGALTGPCQGKYCLPSRAPVASRVRPAGHRDSRRVHRQAAPLRPVRLGDLVADGRRAQRPTPTADEPHSVATLLSSDPASRRRRHRRCRDRRASPSRESSRARGVRDIVIVDRGYPGSGATGRNVARIRAMQLTEELTHVALACQAKYDRMGEELGFNVLFYRLGYAWVLYEADEVERMRAIVEMHHRIGVASALLSPDDTLRRLPILRGGDRSPGPSSTTTRSSTTTPSSGPTSSTSPGRGVRSCRARRSRAIDRGDAGVTGVETTAAGSRPAPWSTPRAAGRPSSTPWPACPHRTARSVARSS